jgi:hypothetical protein
VDTLGFTVYNLHCTVYNLQFTIWFIADSFIITTYNIIYQLLKITSHEKDLQTIANAPGNGFFTDAIHDDGAIKPVPPFRW